MAEQPADEGAQQMVRAAEREPSLAPNAPKREHGGNDGHARTPANKGALTYSDCDANPYRTDEQ